MFDLTTDELTAIGGASTIVIGESGVSTGTLTVDGTADFSGDSLTIYAGSIVDGASGVLTAGTLSADVGTGSIALDNADVHGISNLGAVTADGGFTLDNGDTSLTVTGTLSTTGNVSIDVGAGTYAQNLSLIHI